jgi:hypothetical protein
MPRFEMEQELFSNDPSTQVREFDAQDLRRVARAVLGRALYDLTGTTDYGKYRPCAVPGCESSTAAMLMGEELRRWFREDEWYVFSFRLCCDLAGYCYRKIRRGIEKYMEPANRQLVFGIDRCEKDVVEYIRNNPGVSHYALKRDFQERQHPTVLRLALRRLREGNQVYAKSIKETNRQGNRKDVQRWYPNV